MQSVKKESILKLTWFRIHQNLKKYMIWVNEYLNIDYKIYKNKYFFYLTNINKIYRFYHCH